MVGSLTAVSSTFKQGFTMRLTPILFFTLLVSLSSSAPVAAWDSVGHRLSAAVVLNYLDERTQEKLIEILSAHPRWQQDYAWWAWTNGNAAGV